MKILEQKTYRQEGTMLFESSAFNYQRIATKIIFPVDNALCLTGVNFRENSSNESRDKADKVYCSLSEVC